MKMITNWTILTLAIVAIFAQSCGIFGENDACSDVVCPQSDVVEVLYKSSADSTIGLFDAGQFSLEQLDIRAILLDQNGPAPFVLKAKLGPAQKPTVQITVHENLRGLVLKLANFPPDTMLLTSGLRAAEACCEETVTVSQLLVNGQVVPSIGSVIFVEIFK